jgi:Right handed beta helix region
VRRLLALRRASRGSKISAAAVVVLVAAVALVVAQASAHIERASYWPNPAPDTSVTPPAGGKVPQVRSLFSALKTKPVGSTRVVCQGRVPNGKRLAMLTRKFRKARKQHASKARVSSLRRKIKVSRRKYRARVNRNFSIKQLKKGIATARTSGYKFRPSEATRKLSKKEAKRLLKFNERLLGKCKYHRIQTAVTRSHNNDRVVIMPGLYTESKSRAQPTNDPKCASLRQQNDRNQTGAVSYAYQYKCPNDQNLIAVMGRKPGTGKDPQPPLLERRGIPNLGPCVRCNFQMEGSGARPEDVVVDAGRTQSGDHGPIGAKKDVGIRGDRADGFVLRNIKVRHAKEHGIYVLESDGYVLERFKAFYSGEYGVLTFVEDHGVMQDCEAAGSGDSGLYPGAAAETGEQTVESKRRYNQEMRRCDSHHNTSGYSGTASNGVHIHDNDFYDNALGFTTDVFTAAGHPGFPQDSDLVEHNNFYSNNFNPYVKGSDVEPSVPVPVGTGMWIAGGNNNTVRNNHFWDNWRRGTMLFAVPDSTVCGPAADGNEQAGCSAGKISTSFRNRYYGNVMGRTPGGKTDPNGTDFWWDNFANNTNNCWYSNTGKNGTAASVTSTPNPLPGNCATSRGTGGPAQETELLACLADFSYGHTGSCPWFTTPAEPKP